MVIIGVIVITISGAAVDYRETQRGKPREVTFEQLKANPDEYDGGTIIIEAGGDTDRC